jgi:hypothetical protein
MSSGSGFTSASLIKTSADTAIAYDFCKAIRRHTDYGIGYDTHVPGRILALLRKLDVARGLEYLIRSIHVSDSLIALLETVGSVDRQLLADVDRQLLAEVTNDDESSVRTVTTSDFGVGRSTESVVSKLRTISVSESAKARDEFFTAGYPVSETPLQDLINAYPHAFQQLSTLRDGRYAYAQDWNVLADYAKAIINALVNQINELYARGVTHYADLYNRVLECHRILSTYKYLKTGDVIMPEHTNTLIDVARCLNLGIRLLLRKAITRHSEMDVATGLDKATQVDETPWTFIMVDTDDWDTAKRYIIDGTIIFVNADTHAMTPDEVRTIVNNKNVVFALLVKAYPHSPLNVGAFYDVFYTSKSVTGCDVSHWVYQDCIVINDPKFYSPFGLYACSYASCPTPWGIPLGVLLADDYPVHPGYKIAGANTWAFVDDRAPGYRECGFSYAKYDTGAIIEVPYDGLWIQLLVFDFYIGMLANALLGEPSRCRMYNNTVRLRRVVWMASYDSKTDRVYCFTADECIRRLALLSMWSVVDLRTR